jgi:preprotein translocase subunit SecG
METVIIVIHLMVIVALIAVVLLQRSEGGALGIGGSNAFLSSRGQGNVLTRATAILAAVFFVTSLALTVISRLTAPPSAILNNIPATATQQPAAPTGNGTALPGAPAPTTGAPATGGVLNQLNQYLNKSAPAPIAAPTPDNGVAVPPASTSAPETAAPATTSPAAGAAATSAPETPAPATPAPATSVPATPAPATPQVPNSQ